MTSDLRAEPARLVSVDPPATEAATPSQRKPLDGAIARFPAPRLPERWRLPLPLLLVLPVQAALSLSLANGTSANEALALLSDRAALHGLTHRAIVTALFAPYIAIAHLYHPMIRAAFGAQPLLEAVRLLSLLAMLGATTLLWWSTRALFGGSAAVCATAVFGLAGPTLFLGHAALPDVAAVLLYAMSLRILIATARLRLWTTLLAVPTTVLAVAASHATLVYVPALALVACFAAATAAPGPAERLLHLARGALFAVAVGALAWCWIALGAPVNRRISEATRITVNGSVHTVIAESIEWGGTTVVLGLLGALAVARRPRVDPRDPHRVAPVLLTLTLAVSATLAPAYALYRHTARSLLQQIAVGLLLSTVAAGVALSAPLRTTMRARMRHGAVADHSDRRDER